MLSGYADVYYKYNFNKNETDNKTSFTNSHNSFELGMISLKVQHAFGKVSVYGDLGFGKRADEFSYTDEKTSLAIKQLYVSYAPADWVTLALGSFATHVGYELVDADLNRNYSMSYMFSYGPFSHTGLKATFKAGDHSFMVGVFNPTDYKYAPPDSKKYIGAQWAFTPSESGFSSYLNYIGGEDTSGLRNDQLDVVLNYTVSDHFSLGYNGTYSHYKFEDNKTAWWGSALYLNGDFTEHFGLTLRGEYFSDKDGVKVFTDAAAFPDGGSVLSFTLSGNCKIGGHLRLVPEIRLDQASETLFNKGNGSPTQSSPSALFAAIYSF
ncbi:hypothetical protein GCM10023143_03550 [Compostibacter hankyongensis]|uniref:Porin n=1 Tax=Compostibacter hankyongensis TaxID=1007089 RepID=A0ABP8FE66_9BACT